MTHMGALQIVGPAVAGSAAADGHTLSHRLGRARKGWPTKTLEAIAGLEALREERQRH